MSLLNKVNAVLTSEGGTNERVQRLVLVGCVHDELEAASRVNRTYRLA